MKLTTVALILIFAVELLSGLRLKAQAQPTQQAQTPAPAPPPGNGLTPPALTFPQQTRKLASPEVIARGKAVFGVNCTACHGADLRGGDLGGPNLLRSEVALTDQHGELIGPIIHGSRQDKGMPAFNLSNDDVVAVAEYIHSILAKVGRQGRPPGAGGEAELQVIVGSPVAGKAYFDSKCASCHSVTGDLAGIATKYTDGRTLQNTWVAGVAGGGRGGFGAPAPPAPGAKPATVTVTMASGEKIEGNLVQQNEFVVTLIDTNGIRRTITRDARVTSVSVQDPSDAHKQMVRALNDKDMHDVTAYLATIK